VESIEEDRLIWHKYLEKALQRGSSPSKHHIDSGDNNKNAQLMFSQALNYCKNDVCNVYILYTMHEHVSIC
jgi:TPR repeat protein